jgi:hypothetical protein
VKRPSPSLVSTAIRYVVPAVALKTASLLPSATRQV